MKNKIIIGAIAVCILLYLRKEKLKKESENMSSSASSEDVNDLDIDFIRTEIYKYIKARNTAHNIYKTPAQINIDVMYITRNVE